MQKRVDVLHGSIAQALLFLMVPILICGIFQQICGMIDAIVVGRYVGSAGVAVIGGSCSTLITLFTNVSSNMILGCMTVIAFLYGKDQSRTAEGVNTSMFLTAICAVCFTGAYILAAEPILRLLQVPEELMAMSVSYLRLYSLAFVPYALFQLAVTSFRAFGETKAPTELLIGSFLMNIALDLLFVGVFHLQQNGIAYAFLLTQFLFAAASLYALVKAYMIPLFQERPDQEVMARILKIAVPACIASSFYSLTNLIIQSAMNMLGSETIAAFAIHNKIENIYWIIMGGFGVAITTVISQNCGAKSEQRVRKGIETDGILCFALTAAVSLCFFLFNHQLVALFTNEANTQILASGILALMTPCYFFYPLLETISDSLKCLGKASQSTVITLISICCVRIVWILLFVRDNITLDGILLAYPISWFCASILFVLYYLRKKKSLLKSIA